MKLEALRQAAEAAGVVGAGGAGFPTRHKLVSGIHTLIVNAVECEPLLQTDLVLLEREWEGVAAGAELAREALGAERLILAVKEHNAPRLGITQGGPFGPRGEVALVPGVYPMGDELVLIYQVLGEVIPPGLLPSARGVAVVNAETAFNLGEAARGNGVTHTWITVGGAVERSVVARVPVGVPAGDVLEALGLSLPEGHVLVDGGPAMGTLCGPGHPVTKRTKGLLVLPERIPAVANKLASPDRQLKRILSACCGCSFCTDLCPRRLLGYPLEPHRTLRSVGAGSLADPDSFLSASLCSGCGLCTLAACCQSIAPSAAMLAVKESLGRHGLGYQRNGMPQGDGTPRGDETFQGDVPSPSPHPQRDFRLVPSDRFARLAGVAPYQRQAEWLGDLELQTERYVLPLSQHAGAPAIPVVAVGDRVEPGGMVARPGKGISAAIHTPVPGTVSQVGTESIQITRGGEGR